MWSGEEGFAGGVSGGPSGGESPESDSGSLEDDESQNMAQGVPSVKKGRRKPGGWKNRKTDKSKIGFRDFRNPWNFFQVFLNSEEEAHDWCRTNGLLATSLPCHKCDDQMILRPRKGSVANESFRCNKNRGHELQTRLFSFFEGTKLPVNDIMLFTKSYLDKNSLLQCSTFSGISYGSTGVNWGVNVREIFKDYFARHIRDEKLRGEIEIDESLFGRKVKYHRGNPNVGVKVWVFGLVHRDSNTIILYPVSDRKEATLIPIIQRHVAPGSTIYSDGWSAYCDLNALGYKHFTVLHKYSFKKTYVNVETNEEVVVHTNRIEGAWMHAKSHFRRMSGTNTAQFEGHLAEVMWRSRVKSKLYEKFFNDLKTIYHLAGPPEFAFSRSQSLFDSWDGLAQTSPEKEMVLPTATDAESEAESSDVTPVTSAPLPSILQSSASAPPEPRQEVPVVEISSDDSYIPPNRPRVSPSAQPTASKETERIVAEMFSGASSSETEQDQTLLAEPSPVTPVAARPKRPQPKRSSRLRERAEKEKEQSSDSSATAMQEPVRRVHRRTRAPTKEKAPSTRTEMTSGSTSVTEQPASTSMHSRPRRKEHICHPVGFEEKDRTKERPKRKTKPPRRSSSNPYSKWNFVPDFESSDDDFQK